MRKTRVWSQIVMGLVLCLCLGTSCTNRQEQAPASGITEERLARDIADYTAAINANAQDAEAYYGRGNAYGHEGEYDRAIEDFNKALQIDPQFARAYCARGTAYSHRGEYDRAIENFNKTLQIDSQDAEAYCERGSAYFEQEKWAEARSDLEKAVELDPKGWAGEYAQTGLDRLTQDWPLSQEFDACILKDWLST